GDLPARRAHRARDHAAHRAHPAPAAPAGLNPTPAAGAPPWRARRAPARVGEARPPWGERATLRQRSDDLDELELELEILAGERVVGVERYRLVGDVDHGQPQPLPAGIPPLQLLADLEIDLGRNGVPLHLVQQLRPARTVRLVRGDGHGLLLARGHPD